LIYLPDIQCRGQAYEYMERAKAKLIFVLRLTLVVIILLYLNFRNIAEVLIIMGTLPLAMIGGIWLLYVEGFNFSVAVGVGFIVLAGVSVEIGVIMLVYLKQACNEAIEWHQVYKKRLLL
jgi:Cu(I)/Ag(I) efflux system membrane protein CusA/SilA